MVLFNAEPASKVTLAQAVLSNAISVELVQKLTRTVIKYGI